MDSTVAWLYAAECETGGISAWKGPQGWHSAYPEVTGYLLPTMHRWGAVDLSIRCTDWLVSIQNKDGSWNGLDGIPRPFDTSAIVEGLQYMYDVTLNPSYCDAYDKAITWLLTQIQPDGHLSNSPTNQQPEVYNLRASSIIGNRRELHYWHGKDLIGTRQRSHYLAYAIEGLFNFGAKDEAMPYINLAYNSANRMMPFYVDGQWNGTHDFDVCATAQMGINFKRAGLDADKQYQAVKAKIHGNGGVPQSTADEREIAWAAKFFLDLKEVLQ